MPVAWFRESEVRVARWSPVPCSRGWAGLERVAELCEARERAANGWGDGIRGRTGLTRSEIAYNPYQTTTGLLEDEVPCQIALKGVFSALLILLEMSLVALIRHRSKPDLHVGNSRLYSADRKGRR
jgi:hypothetical protein